MIKRTNIVDRVNKGRIPNLRKMDEETIREHFSLRIDEEIVRSINKAECIEKSDKKEAGTAIGFGLIALGVGYCIRNVAEPWAIVAYGISALSVALGARSKYDADTAEMYIEAAEDYLHPTNTYEATIGYNSETDGLNISFTK